MNRRPQAGVDAALSRLILQQRVAAQEMGLKDAMSQLQARAQQISRVVTIVRRRPGACMAAGLALGLALGLVNGRRRS